MRTIAGTMGTFLLVIPVSIFFLLIAVAFGIEINFALLIVCSLFGISYLTGALVLIMFGLKNDRHGESS